MNAWYGAPMNTRYTPTSSLSPPKGRPPEAEVTRSERMPIQLSVGEQRVFKDFILRATGKTMMNSWVRGAIERELALLGMSNAVFQKRQARLCAHLVKQMSGKSRADDELLHLMLKDFAEEVARLALHEHRVIEPDLRRKGGGDRGLRTKMLMLNLTPREREAIEAAATEETGITLGRGRGPVSAWMRSLISREMRLHGALGALDRAVEEVAGRLAPKLLASPEKLATVIEGLATKARRAALDAPAIEGFPRTADGAASQAMPDPQHRAA